MLRMLAQFFFNVERLFKAGMLSLFRLSSVVRIQVLVVRGTSTCLRRLSHNHNHKASPTREPKRYEVWEIWKTATTITRQRPSTVMCAMERKVKF